MKHTTLVIATAAIALLGGAAFAQTPAPMPGDHMPADKMPAKPTVSVTSTTETPAPAATSSASDVSAGVTTFTNLMVTNGPVPDTAENRAKYGQPMSNAGKRTAAKGN